MAIDGDDQSSNGTSGSQPQGKSRPDPRVAPDLAGLLKSDAAKPRQLTWRVFRVIVPELNSNFPGGTRTARQLPYLRAIGRLIRTTRKT